MTERARLTPEAEAAVNERRAARSGIVVGSFVRLPGRWARVVLVLPNGDFVTDDGPEVWTPR